MRIATNIIGRGAALFLLMIGTAFAGGDSQLVDAVKRRDLTEVKALLRKKVDVNFPVGGATALHWAVRRNDLETVELLLDAGANVNVSNDLGVTPLSLACTNGEAGMVSRLLNAGADPNAAQITGETVLMTCAHQADARAVNALLAAGAKPNAEERLQRQTALMWAVAGGRPDAVKLLLGYGANVNARTISQTELVRDMTARPRRGGPVPSIPHLTGGFTPLLFAARHGELESAKLMLTAGADVNDKAADGLSALVIAAQSNHGKLGALLLDQGANPNAADGGYTALHAAILRSNLELVKSLLAHGADPNATITKSNPVRRYGYQWDIDSSLVGATPFFLAAKFAEPEIMIALAAGGADPLRPIASSREGPSRSSGTTPLMVAAGLGWDRPTDVGSSGSDRRGRTLSRDRIFAEWDDEERWLATVKLALAFKPDVNAENAAGDTAMHGAARMGLRRVVELLMENGGKLDGKNKAGDTPESLLRLEKPRR